MMMNKTYKITAVITAIGALNWGLVGFTGMFVGTSIDIVDWFWIGLLGAPLFLADFTYLIIGIAAVVFLVHLFKRQ